MLITEGSFIFNEEDYKLIEQDSNSVFDMLDSLNEKRLNAIAIRDNEMIAEYEKLQKIEDKLKNQSMYEDLFDLSKEHVFVFEIQSDTLQNMTDDMNLYHEQFGNYKSNQYYNIDVSYFCDDELEYIEDVAIRSKGNDFSRRTPLDGEGNYRPIHYVMKFNETFDLIDGTEDYIDLKTREVFDLENLVFKWNKNGDQTNISELYAYEMFRLAGVDIPRVTLAEVIIKENGVVIDSRLYTVIEAYDEEYIRRSIENYDEKPVGDLYKAIWSGTLEPIGIDEINTWRLGIRDWTISYRPTYSLQTNTDNPNYMTLINFTSNLNDTNLASRKAFIESSFDVDSWLRSMAMNVLLGNPDDYRGNGNNTYYYFGLDGVMQYIPFDYDHCLGQGWNGDPQFTNYSIGNDIYEWGFPDWAWFSTPLWDNIIVYDEYKVLYEDYLEEFINSGLFSHSMFTSYYEQARSIYGDRYSFNNNNKWYFDQKIEAVLEDLEYHNNN